MLKLDKRNHKAEEALKKDVNLRITARRSKYAYSMKPDKKKKAFQTCADRAVQGVSRKRVRRRLHQFPRRSEDHSRESRCKLVKSYSRSTDTISSNVLENSESY